MKDGWEIKKLGEVCEIQGGATPKRTEPFSGEGGTYPWFTIEDIRKQGRYINDTQQKITKLAWEKSRIFPKDTVLLCCTATIGEYALTCIPLTTNQQFNGLVIKDKSYLTPKYLMHYCSTIKQNLLMLSGKATIDFVSAEKLRQIPIPIPPREEQERIVGILDREFERIDALKANVEQNLQHAKDLFQAALQQELQPKEGWVTYRLQDVCTEYGDYGMSLSSKPYDGIRYLRITDITEWGDLNNEMVSADTDVVDERYILREGDILFARTGATVGKTLVYNESMGCCSYAGYLIRYRLNQSIILPLVMYYITHSKEYYEWIVSNQKSATLPNISAKLYNSYEICIPKTLTEQNEMISRLGKLKAHCKTLEENYKKTIALCDDMKQALLRKAFNGEL